MATSAIDQAVEMMAEAHQFITAATEAESIGNIHEANELTAKAEMFMTAANVAAMLATAKDTARMADALERIAGRRGVLKVEVLP